MTAQLTARLSNPNAAMLGLRRMHKRLRVGLER